MTPRPEARSTNEPGSGTVGGGKLEGMQFAAPNGAKVTTACECVSQIGQCRIQARVVIKVEIAREAE